MLVTFAMGRVASVPAIAWKAALLGTKTVMSERESTAETRFAASRAPTREEVPSSMAVWEQFSGIVRTLSIMWMYPPV
jgi:hypothetical protein